MAVKTIHREKKNHAERFAVPAIPGVSRNERGGLKHWAAGHVCGSTTGGES
jgi:hypothetical protein